MSTYDYDLFIIGGGSGGVRAARLAGSLGKRVAIAEEYRIGGTCVIRGCIPKKLFAYASAYSDVFKDMTEFGWSLEKTRFNWQQLVASKNHEITRLEGEYHKSLQKSQVKIYQGRAVFIDAWTLQIHSTGERVTAEKILIASGSRPKIPDYPGKELCLSSNDAFNLKTLPKSIVIVGGGYVAVEFASIFHGLGVETVLVYRGSLMLRHFDDDLRLLLQKAMEIRGIRIICNAMISRIEKQDNRYTAILSDGKKLMADQVMLALGRIPNTDGIGLDRAGLATDRAGAVVVNSYMQTKIDHIWAIGDVTNHVCLTPVAIHEAMCFIRTAFENEMTAPDYDLIATAVFSQPEIGTVGLSEERAAQKFSHVEIYRAYFRPLRHTVSGRNERMLTKLVVDGDRRTVLGVHILGPNASEMIQLLAISLKGKLTKDVFDATMALHPTAAEELVTMYSPSYCYRHGKKVKN
ncbi:MAG: glutathione reductase (NADPH) [Candidatus Tokpelaia sp. JSC085]|nr:MAG: glutathione reductase (NADPH) [Candidatus Tokpelaia sp. JSC085]